MKAIVYHCYGPPDVLKLEEIEKPTPSDDEVLIRIRAASVNPYDWHFMRGEPYLLRIAAGLRRPKNVRLGADVAGEVEAVGRNVMQLKPGDAVFGTCQGSFAEYACGSASRLALKPACVTFEQAASTGIAALSALQGLRDKGHIQPNYKVLVNGAAGGVGSFAVQIARWFGAEVTGVCSSRNLDMVRSIGAKDVVDYTREDFTRGSQRYDILLDCVGNRSLLDCRRVLSEKGIYVAAGGKAGRWMAGALLRWFASRALSLGSRKFVSFFANINHSDLNLMADLMESEKVKPVVDRAYALSQVPDAIHYLEQGHARGKVLIAVA
jgi:NADPH:quinone reductase-like Zn-dependent oxidoreductase